MKPPFTGTPGSEINIHKAMVRSLLKDQHPDLAHLPLYKDAEGWDNVIFRLGDKLAVRLPRRQEAAALIGNEQTWLPFLANYLPLPVPVMLRAGFPSFEYPWQWSVLPWLPGNPADMEEPHASQAFIFTSFLTALHRNAPSNAPVNPWRGVPLEQRAPSVMERMHRLQTNTKLITKKISDLWSQSTNIPVDNPKKWIHGDLHARNILVQKGQITGIIDWGDISAGDIATDLAAVWTIFPDKEARRTIRSTYTAASAETWQRAIGWAILFAVTLLDTGLTDNPRNAAIGAKILRHIAEDDGNL
jgi:aminoglycoside phosphotransferase (APT) family kinase protein